MESPSQRAMHVMTCKCVGDSAYSPRDLCAKNGRRGGGSDAMSNAMSWHLTAFQTFTRRKRRRYPARGSQGEAGVNRPTDMVVSPEWISAYRWK